MYRCKIKCNLRIYAHVWKGYGWPFCGGVVTGRVLVPPPQIIGAPPPPLQAAAPHKKSYMFRFVDIARVFILRPHKYAYVFLKYALQILILLLLWLFLYPHHILTRWWPFIFLPACSDWKGAPFLVKRFFFWGGGGRGSAQNVSAPYENPRPLACPIPHLKNRSYATAFWAPGRDWLCGFWNISFILLSLPCTPS